MEILTVSEMKCFRRCAREHRYHYERRIRRKTSALRLLLGTYVHLLLELYWRARQAGAKPTELLPAPVPDGLPPHEVARGRAMALVYQARWNAEDVQVLGVETQFRLPLVDPATGQTSVLWRLGGKIDAAIRWRGHLGIGRRARA